MLTKYVVFCLVIAYAFYMTKKNRTARVLLTPEAMVLKQLRERHGLSMRAAGAKLGYSDSYISQIENGRENVPYGERLNKFLILYGNITERYFKQLCKDWKDEATDKEQLVALLGKLSDAKVSTLLSLAQQMADGKI